MPYQQRSIENCRQNSYKQFDNFYKIWKMSFITENSGMLRPKSHHKHSYRLQSLGHSESHTLVNYDWLQVNQKQSKEQIKTYNMNYYDPHNSHYKSNSASKHTITPSSNSFARNFQNTKFKFSKKVSTHCSKSVIAHNTKNSNKKWNEIVELYHGTKKDKMDEQQNQAGRFQSSQAIANENQVREGLNFYKMLAQIMRRGKYSLSINFPETLVDCGQRLYLLFTDPNKGILEHEVIIKSESHSQMLKCLQKWNSLSRQHTSRYRKMINFKENQYAPVVVTKYSEDYEKKFDVDIESYQTFQQKKTRPNQNKIVQRFIYPHNSKAMIFRLNYQRKSFGEQRNEYEGFRFVNKDDIFLDKRHQVTKFQATICPSYEREEKVQLTKITNPRSLKKFIIQSQSLRNCFQSLKKTKVTEMSIDFIVDVFDIPWMIGIKRCKLADRRIGREESGINCFDVLGKSSACRVCLNIYSKEELKKTISNKILIEFLNHLKKRMQIHEYQSLGFIKQISSIHLKSHISFHICDCCYKLISEEFKLIECEKKLGAICSIKPTVEGPYRQSSQLFGMYQWRLMIFLVDIINVPPQFMKTNSNVNVKYSFDNKKVIQQSWKVKTNSLQNSSGFFNSFSSDININKVKIHYFYSEKINIDQFLKDTEVHLELQTNQKKSFAKGSSGILSAFSNRLQGQLCLRQTSSTLLFYTSGKYCELTIKIGLICDGLYEVRNQKKLEYLNGVYFQERGFTNSNSIPRQWMQAFGINDDLLSSKRKKQNMPGECMKNRTKNKTCLHKKPIYMF